MVLGLLSPSWDYMSRRLLTAICLAALGILNAATLERLLLDDMIRKSTLIVRGQVLSSRSSQHGSLIHTWFRVQVLEQWKGTRTSQAEVMVPGGRLAGLRQTFSGAPKLLEGSEYVLFLWTGPSGRTQVIGFSQGVFDLKLDDAGQPIAVRGASTETMVDSRTGAGVRDEDIRMTLTELRDRVLRVVGAARQ